ncbi:polysaccharide pyruvyl transferase family protein [Arenibacter algicola]|uniref:polysaccharide pyruvyl transferase family protein n=1 Tax=Arenibacter algicola TaxID=616991 RepID=UPI001C06CADB|nr:polysaccharide pyruvyl transferase family protein [Arenibacter algicola]MBU2907269.1 polysaccharide pyruvyl transferase family protein [Arenibacter algicola]
MKIINLYWHKTNQSHGNFGDELNHFIVSKLTGSKINQIIIPSKGFNYIYRALSYIYKKKSTKDVLKLFKQFFVNDFVVGIGSIIAIPKNPRAKVWGSGIIKKDDIINKSNFYAVRGSYTQKRLVELNLIAPETIGDPALLLPLVYEVDVKKKYCLGIIPHYIHYNSINNNLKHDSILIINLLDPIEKIINEIVSCERTISTSLHGIIVSHAYKIPCLWYVFSGKNLAGDNIKFYDYFSSVDIEEYSPFSLNIVDFNLEKIIKLFKIHSQNTLINNNLIEIQQQLIKVAPFPILDKYKSKPLLKK